MKKVIALLSFAVCCTVTTAMAQGGGQQRTPEERIAAMKETLKPLNLTAVQTDSVVAIMMDRSMMQGMGNFRDMSQEDRAAAMKKISDARVERMKKAGISEENAKKVIEVAGQRGGGRPGGGGGK